MSLSFLLHLLLLLLLHLVVEHLNRTLWEKRCVPVARSGVVASSSVPQGDASSYPWEDPRWVLQQRQRHRSHLCLSIQSILSSPLLFNAFLIFNINLIINPTCIMIGIINQSWLLLWTLVLSLFFLPLPCFELLLIRGKCCLALNVEQFKFLNPPPLSSVSSSSCQSEWCVILDPSPLLHKAKITKRRSFVRESINTNCKGRVDDRACPPTKRGKVLMLLNQSSTSLVLLQEH